MKSSHGGIKAESSFRKRVSCVPFLFQRAVKSWYWVGHVGPRVPHGLLTSMACRSRLLLTIHAVQAHPLHGPEYLSGKCGVCGMFSRDVVPALNNLGPNGLE